MAQGSSSSTYNLRNGNGVECNCKCPAKIVKSWTDANPGRRFYTCGRGRKVGNRYENCNFFRWFDLEKPHGWQYQALLEARDLIREQKEEIKKLKFEMSQGERRERTNPSEIVEEFLLNLEE